MCEYCRNGKELDTHHDSYIKGKELFIWNDMHDAHEEIKIVHCPMCGDELVEDGQLTTQEKRKLLISSRKWEQGMGSCLYNHLFGTRGVDVAYELHFKHFKSKP